VVEAGLDAAGPWFGNSWIHLIATRRVWFAGLLRTPPELWKTIGEVGRSMIYGVSDGRDINAGTTGGDQASDSMFGR
jgi:hypothetical protein